MYNPDYLEILGARSRAILSCGGPLEWDSWLACHWELP
jgi:hypothetical protein